MVSDGCNPSEMKFKRRQDLDQNDVTSETSSVRLGFDDLQKGGDVLQTPNKYEKSGKKPLSKETLIDNVENSK